MDNNQFLLVESLIPGDEIEQLLDTATNAGELVKSATLVAEKYAIRPPALIDWYEARLRLKTIALKEQIFNLSPSVT